MTPIEKFLKESYTPTVTEDKDGIKCIFKHNSSLTEDGVIYFEVAKRGWVNKPIQTNMVFIITDAKMDDVLSFLNTYYNLNEESFPEVRKLLIDMAINCVERFYIRED